MRPIHSSACLIALALIALPGAGQSTRQVPAAAADIRTPTLHQNREQQDQGTAQKDFSLKVRVDLVTVDTIVRNKQGAMVDDLRGGDFVVFDNGAAQPLTHFSRDQLPLAVALLIDCSPSIRNYLPELRNAALAALRRLKPEDQVVLYSFDQCPTRQSDLTEDRERIVQTIGELKVGSGTNIYATLIESARYLHTRAPDRRRAIILISDNYSNTFGSNEKDGQREALEASATLFSIRTPGDNSGNFGDPGAIERIAKETGGEVLKLSKEDKLAGALDQAMANLRMGYTLGFAASPAGDDGSFHRLMVKLANEKSCPGCRVQARSGYYLVSQTSRERAGVVIGATAPPYNCEESVAEASAERRIWMAANSQIDLRGVLFQVNTEITADAREKPLIRVSLHIEPAGVRFRTIDDRHVGRLDVVVYYGDAKGNYLGEEWKVADLQMDEENYQQFLRDGVAVPVLIPLKRPGQILKVVVCDVWSGRLGSRLLSMKTNDE